MSDSTIADTIVSQMGGFGTLKLFVNGRNFVADDSSVMFKFSGSRKFNFCRVIYNYGMDLYEMHFIKVWGDKRKEEVVENVYCDMLVEIFENKTKLYLHF